MTGGSLIYNLFTGYGLLVIVSNEKELIQQGEGFVNRKWTHRADDSMTQYPYLSL